MDDKLNELTAEERQVIINKGTEIPFSGEYDKLFDGGLYVCRQCDAALYRSEHKFQSTCGWPSFDDEIEGAVKRKSDADGNTLCKLRWASGTCIRGRRVNTKKYQALCQFYLHEVYQQ